MVAMSSAKGALLRWRRRLLRSFAVGGHRNQLGHWLAMPRNNQIFTARQAFEQPAQGHAESFGKVEELVERRQAFVGVEFHQKVGVTGLLIKIRAARC